MSNLDPMSPGRSAGRMPASVRERALRDDPRPKHLRTYVRPDHLPALDGLRALAVAAVVAYHLGELGGGFTGVDLFFVLSGFLISRLLIAEYEGYGRISLKSFWARRMRRLLPAMLLAAAGTALAMRFVYPTWRLADLRNDALAAIGYVANWRFVLSGQSYFTEGISPSPFRHTWSLAVEEQFYLIWPIATVAVVAALRRRARLGVAVLSLVVLVASASWMTIGAERGIDTTRLYYGTDTRIFAMAFGALLAAGFDPARHWLRRRSERVNTVIGELLTLIGLVGVGWGFLFADTGANITYRGGLVLVGLFSAVAVAGAGTLGESGPVLGRVLRSQPLQWVGARSYGIYLYSWPIQMIVTERYPLASRLNSALATVGLTLVVAAASYRWVERPILGGRWPFQVTSRPVDRREPNTGLGWLRPGALMASVALVAGALFVVGQAGTTKPEFLTVKDKDVVDAALSPETFGQKRSTVTTAPVVKHEVGELVDPGPNPPFDPASPSVIELNGRKPESVFGRQMRVTFIGDSVGWTIAWFAPQTPQMRVSDRAVIGCGVLPPTYRWMVGEDTYPYGDSCTVQAESEAIGLSAGPDVVVLWLGAWEVLDQLKPDGTVLKAESAPAAKEIATSIQNRVDAARAVGAGTLISMVPCLDGRGTRPYSAARRDPKRRAWVNEVIAEVADHNPGWVRLLNPQDVLCQNDKPIYEIDGMILRSDGTHFGKESAAWFWKTWLTEAISSAFPPGRRHSPAGG